MSCPPKAPPFGWSIRADIYDRVEHFTAFAVLAALPSLDRLNCRRIAATTVFLLLRAALELNSSTQAAPATGTTSWRTPPASSSAWPWCAFSRGSIPIQQPVDFVDHISDHDLDHDYLSMIWISICIFHRMPCCWRGLQESRQLPSTLVGAIRRAAAWWGRHSACRALLRAFIFTASKLGVSALFQHPSLADNGESPQFLAWADWRPGRAFAVTCDKTKRISR